MTVEPLQPIALLSNSNANPDEEQPMTTPPSPQNVISDHETDEIIRANTSGQTPVVFVHGLWLLPSSWDRWAKLFRSAGYATLQPGWPDDPDTVEEANANPEVFAG